MAMRRLCARMIRKALEPTCNERCQSCVIERTGEVDPLFGHEEWRCRFCPVGEWRYPPPRNDTAAVS